MIGAMNPFSSPVQQVALAFAGHVMSERSDALL